MKMVQALILLAILFLLRKKYLWTEVAMKQFRRQLVEVLSFYLVEHRDCIRVIRISDKWLYSLNHFTGPIYLFIFFWDQLLLCNPGWPRIYGTLSASTPKCWYYKFELPRLAPPYCFSRQNYRRERQVTKSPRFSLRPAPLITCKDGKLSLLGEYCFIFILFKWVLNSENKARLRNEINQGGS